MTAVAALSYSATVRFLLTEYSSTLSFALSRPSAISRSSCRCMHSVIDSSVTNSALDSTRSLLLRSAHQPSTISLTSEGTSRSSRNDPEVYTFRNLTSSSPTTASLNCAPSSSLDTPSVDSMLYPHIEHPPLVACTHPDVLSMTTPASTMAPPTFSFSVHTDTGDRFILFLSRPPASPPESVSPPAIKSTRMRAPS